MKIIEALKQVKDLQRKVEDLRRKVAQHSAHMDYETPVYKNQKEQVSKWIQSHFDILKEILRLRFAIQKTNISTSVSITLNNVAVKKTIAEWIHRRRDLANLESTMWKQLTDRGLKEGSGTNSMGNKIEVKLVRCYDPQQRDEMISFLDSEPSLIDGKLEIVNATTELIE